MRLVIFTQTFPPEKGGNASRMGDLCRYLTELGVEVMVVSAVETYPFGSFARKRELLRREGNVIRLFTYQPGQNVSSIERILYYTIFPILASIWLIVNRNVVNMIVVTSPPPQMYIIALTGKLLRKKVIIDVRDLFLDVSISLGFIRKGSLVERVFRFIESEALKSADAITTVTYGIRKQLWDNYSIDPSKCYIVPNGVDLDIFKCSNHSRNPWMVYTGYFGHAQDFDTFLEGYSLVDVSKRVPLILAGGGETLPEILKKIEKLGLSEWVKYMGVLPRREVIGLLCSSSVGVAPIKADESLRYAIPSKIYEYIACGLPFIAVGQGEIERIAIESKAGCIGRTPEEVALCIERILNSNPRKISVWGKRYISRYNRKNSAKIFLKVLNLVWNDDGET